MSSPEPTLPLDRAAARRVVEGYTPRYTPGGTVSHLIWEPDWSAPGVAYPHAACGWSGTHEYWRGSGSQEEYEEAAALPVCRKCLTAVS